MRTTAVVEAKCPYGARDVTIEKAVKSKDFYIQEEGGSYHLLEEHPH
jgi:hypothetical protein